MSILILYFSFIIDELENEEIQEGSLTDTQYIKLFSAYIYTNELCAAKFLWRRIPESIKANAELQKIWCVSKALWSKHYTQAFELIDCQWSDILEPIMVAIKRRIQQDTLKLIGMHYENIQFDKFQTLMGVNKEQAEMIMESEGWTCKNGYVIPTGIGEPEVGLSGSQEILDRLVTLSSFTSYIEN